MSAISPRSSYQEFKILKDYIALSASGTARNLDLSVRFPEEYGQVADCPLLCASDRTMLQTWNEQELDSTNDQYTGRF